MALRHYPDSCMIGTNGLRSQYSFVHTHCNHTQPQVTTGLHTLSLRHVRARECCHSKLDSESPSIRTDRTTQPTSAPACSVTPASTPGAQQRYDPCPAPLLREGLGEGRLLRRFAHASHLASTNVRPELNNAETRSNNAQPAQGAKPINPSPINSAISSINSSVLAPW